jgi:subtilisin family serine protease
MQAAHAAVAGQVVKTWNLVTGLQLVRLPSGTAVHAAVRQYRQDPNVVYAEPNYIVHALATPNDPDFSQLWNLQNTGQLGGLSGADIRGAQAWNLSTGNSNVVVAVLDTGIDYNHPDLAANVWSASSAFNQTVNGVAISCAIGSHGFNAIAGTCDPMDDNAHGTHVSGIIGAVGNNGNGVVGVNWAVRLVACKFLDQGGNGASSDAITCLDFVKALKDSGINIVATNNSWGGSPFSQALSDAIAAQQQDGILFVTAAGNDFSDNDQLATYPSSYDLPNVVSVAATTRFDSLANFSNIGSHSVHLGAPGQEILSTTPNNTYSVFSGTSMAAPEVTGVAALLAAQNPARDWRAIKNLILAGGDANSALAQTVTGRRLNAFGSMNCSGTTVESRLQPTTSVLAGAVGQPVRLEELNINCGLPNGPVQVTVSPGGGVVNLVDDGTAGDVASGDGVYSGQWTPAPQGSYMLTFPGGDIVQVEVLASYSSSQTTLNYVSITGTNLNLGDDSVAQINPPFPIPFGGGNFPSLFVSSNGTISFANAFDGYVNLPLPQQPPAINGGIQIGPPFFSLVAPFWQDLYPIANTSQNVFWDVVGTAPNRQLVVEWRNVRSFECRNDSSATVTFEVVFTEGSSDVLFNYSDVVFDGACSNQDFGAGATVGIQTFPGVGSQWGFEGQDVVSNTSIRWQTTSSGPTSSPAPTVTTISPSTAGYGASGFTLTVNGSNFVPQSRVQWNLLDQATTFVSSTQLTATIPAEDLAPVNFIDPILISVINPAPGGGLSNPAFFNLSHPVPTITAVTPSSVNAGDFSFVLYVDGTNFFPDSTIYWNGQPTDCSVLVSPTRLAGCVLRNQIANPGTAQIVVGNRPPGGGASNSLPVTILPAPAGIAFLRQQPVNVPRGSEPPPPGERPKPPFQFLGWKYAQSMGGNYLARFMRSRSGAAIPIQGTAGEIRSAAPAAEMSLEPHAQTPASVPHFLLPNSLPADFVPTSVAVGDFNRDGNQDWVVANGGASTLWVYLGKGDGTASLPAIIRLRGQSPLAVVVSDLRKSGVLDLVVAETDSASVEVLLGNGDGTFAPGGLYYLPGPPTALAVADFDRDGKLDILAGVLGASTPGSLALLRGDGTGHFSPPRFSPQEAAGNGFPQSLAVADLNGDGFPDVVETDSNSVAVLSLLNQRDGTFKMAQLIYEGEASAGQFMLSTAIGDLNGDGCADLIATDTFAQVFVFSGNCDGTFANDHLTQTRQYGLGDIGISSALVDVNGDGKLDLVTSGFVLTQNPSFGQDGGNAISVLLGDGQGNFGKPQLFRGTPSMVGLATADLNKDGFPDLIAASQDSDSVAVFLNDHHGGFGQGTGSYLGYISGVNASGVVNAPNSNFVSLDLNGDGHPDLAVLEAGQSYPLPWEIGVSMNDGTGKFSPVARYPIADATFDVGDFKFGDFRNTGKPDLVTSTSLFSSRTSFLSFTPNLGNGTFGKAQITSPFNAAGIMGIGDFNGDGKLDIAMAGTGSCSTDTNCLTILLGKGDGTFQPGFTAIIQPRGPNLNWPAAIYVGDFNRDGKKDLLIWMFTNLQGTDTDDLVELLGNGDGTFQPGKVVLPHLGNFTVVDVNRDGWPDVVEQAEALSTLTTGAPAFNIYLGQSDGSFALTGNYSPFGGEFGGGFFFGQGVFANQGSPMVADFNGDGNPDIAVYQLVPGNNPNTFLQQSYLQLLLGNGDGTFTPSYDTTAFHQLSVPNNAIDVNGDGRAELVELDQMTSGFHVIPTVTGRAFQIATQSTPVVGTNGGVVVSLSLVSSSPTTVSLAASDPAINIAPSVTIPAGSVFQIVPFKIGAAFDASHVFSIQAQLGAETETTYGFQASPNSQYGFVATLGTTTQAALAGGSTLDYGLKILSIAGYSSTLQLSCSGLPAGFSCNFQQTPFNLVSGESSPIILTVSVPAGAALGSYPFTVTASDAAFSQHLNATLNVGDFTVQVIPASQVALPGGTLPYTVTVIGVNGFNQRVDLSCSGLPAGATCALDASWTIAGDQFPPPSRNVTVIAASLPQGTYPFTITGTSARTTHTANAQLAVGGVTAAFSQTTATIQLHGQATIAMTLQSQNGYAGSVLVDCQQPPAGISCQFNPDFVDVPAGGSATTQLILAVSTKPTGQVQPGARRAFHASAMGFRLRLAAGITLLPALFLLPWARRNSWRNRFLLIIVTAGMLSASLVGCGGGSGGSGGGGSGGGGGGGGGTGGGTPVTVQVQVRGSAQSTTVSLGTISVTVP